MKIYFMKQTAIDYFKANINRLYINYYKYSTNEWMEDELGYNPFELFMEIPDFNLASTELRAGEIELDNCKILFDKLGKISPSQASDERLWAGLCNSVFYNYVRQRWGYPKMKYKNVTTDASTIISRFFYNSHGRSGMYRNTLAKCWWVGYLISQIDNSWAYLDAIGSSDFSSKVGEIFYNNNFSSNKHILKGICEALKAYKERGIEITVRTNLRPALQYLNALGGSLLLDMYSSNEITTIIVNKIEQIRNGDEGGIIDDSEHEDDTFDDETNDEFTDEEVNINYIDELESFEEELENFDINSISLELDTVYYGCTVYTLKLPENKIARFPYPSDESQPLSKIMQEMLGKKIGFTAKLGIHTYKIERIESGVAANSNNDERRDTSKSLTIDNAPKIQVGTMIVDANLGEGTIIETTASSVVIKYKNLSEPRRVSMWSLKNGSIKIQF